VQLTAEHDHLKATLIHYKNGMDSTTRGEAVDVSSRMNVGEVNIDARQDLGEINTQSTDENMLD